MSNRPAKITQAKIERAMRAAKAAGFDTVRVEIEKDGKLVVVGGPVRSPSADDAELDAWLTNHAR